MAPTRELAKQVQGDFEAVAPSLASTCIYGGVSYEKQERDIANGIDILVGTPGRIMDLLERGKISLKSVKYVVLDEADEMLNIGFKDQMEAILSSIRCETFQIHETYLLTENKTIKHCSLVLPFQIGLRV
jgi:ATP-dependent RNA helicase DDX21